MGEAQEWLFEPTFNRAIKVRKKDQRITSDAGVLLAREADHRLKLVESACRSMIDPRDLAKIRYTLVELFRERIYALAQGYKAQDDLDRLAHDPAMKMAVWDRPGNQVVDERLASQPTQSRLLDILSANQKNREALREALADWTGRHVRATGKGRRVRHGTVDVDSFPLEIHGEQPGGAYNGYYRRTVYHPLVASFSVGGDYDSGRKGDRLGSGFVHAVLRKGNAASAQGARRFIDRVICRSDALAGVVDVRIDAGLTYGPVMDRLCERNVRFVGRLKGNPVLDALAAPYLKRPVGRPPADGYEDVFELGLHQAESWKFAQRLILVVIDRPDPKTGQLNLLPDYFFLVANWLEEEITGVELLEHYRRRGTFEDRLGEFNAAIGFRLSSPDFLENEVTFLLSLLAFNLASMLRVELEDEVGGCWDLARFQNYVLKAGARVTKHSRRLVMDLACAVVPLWQSLLTCLRRWRLPLLLSPVCGPCRRSWQPPPPHANLTEVLRL